MARKFKPSVVTANDLLNGEILYKTPTGWSGDFKQAEIGETEEALERILAKAHEDEVAQKVTAVYAFDVTVTESGPEPNSMREKVRALRKPTLKTFADDFVS
jgi:hypothetical protein